MWWGSENFISRAEHRVGTGVDHERRPAGVPALASGFARTGTGHRESGCRRAAPGRASPRRSRRPAHRPRQRMQADAPASRNAFAKPPTGGQQVPRLADLTRVEHHHRAGLPQGRPGGVLADRGGAEVLRLDGVATLEPAEQHLGVQDVVGVGGAVAREVQQVEPARAQQVADPVGGRRHLAGAEAALQEGVLLDRPRQREPGIQVRRAQRARLPVRIRMADPGSSRLPAHQPGLGEEPGLLAGAGRSEA